ncbi:MAG: hypothetical protein U0414_17030 [Polyangiaceae bacterium]
MSAASQCKDGPPRYMQCRDYPSTDLLGEAGATSDPISVTPTDGSLALLFETESAWVVLARNISYALPKADTPSPSAPWIVAGLYSDGVWLLFPRDEEGFKAVKAPPLPRRPA